MGGGRALGLGALPLRPLGPLQQLLVLGAARLRLPLPARVVAAGARRLRHARLRSRPTRLLVPAHARPARPARPLVVARLRPPDAAARPRPPAPAALEPGAA